MKLGLGLYRHMLTEDNLRFARQAGATHIVAHLVDYFSAGPRIPASTSRTSGWGPTDRVGKPWTLAEIEQVRGAVEAQGLTLHAIENLDPGHWHDVLLDGPKREEQLAQVLESIRLLGQAGVPCLGYNFSLAGVWGHITGPFARGGAESIGFDAERLGDQPEIPRGQVWNMDFAAEEPDETIGAVDPGEMWSRLEAFLVAAVPVAEAAGVRLCAHPDDPPVPRLRNTARVLSSEGALQRLLDRVPSRANSLEFCQGTISEMPGVDVYAAIARFARQDRIGYVHLRNVVGRVPSCREAFIDDGDVDMPRALRTYTENGYDGVFIPDHTPRMTCAAPWHAGMAYALGYMSACIRLPNGLGWNSQDTTMYLVDSMASTLLAAPYDADDGLIGALAPLCRIDPGLPDGLAVDVDGSIWIAVWGGSEIRRFDSAGRLTGIVPMPVTQPSSCAFGNDGTLYITSARNGLTAEDLLDQPHAGSVFALATTTRGVPIHAFAA